jgi:CRISPR-associated protein Csb1
MSTELLFSDLQSAIGGAAAAFRSVTTLQPVGGEGDKVFPATYAGGKYATEKRRIRVKDAGNGEVEREVQCVLINSVQSEANHAEEALRQTVVRGDINLPIIEVDFSGINSQLRKPLPKLSSLEVPHRLADAILRDALLPDGTRFSKSEYAAGWSKANLWNATPIYYLCPTALLFGLWGSP